MANSINVIRLAKKADYISNNFAQPQFKEILNKAKEFWLQTGKTFRIECIEHKPLCDVYHLKKQDVADAVSRYVLTHGEEMLQKERAANRRYRLRQKHKKAMEFIANGMVPVVYRGRIIWVAGNDPKAKEQIEDGFFPVVKNGDLNWEYAPRVLGIK